VIKTEHLTNLRLKELTSYLISPEGKPTFKKLCGHFSIHRSGYGAVICRSHEEKELSQYIELKNSVKLPIEQQVDMKLYRLFHETKLNINQYEQLSTQVKEKIELFKKKIREQEKQDPVGVYILETIGITTQMLGSILLNKREPSILEKLDERNEVRHRTLEEREIFLHHCKNKCQAVQESIEREKEKEQDCKELIGTLNPKINKKVGALQEGMKKFEGMIGKKEQSQQNFDQLIQQQRKLADRLYQLIRPLLLHFLSESTSDFFGMIKEMFIDYKPPEKREIFMFSDKEIHSLVQLQIVFITDNKTLHDFIKYCLQMDHLENQLMVLCGSNNIPENPNLLILGNDVISLDFTNYVEKSK